MEHVQSHKTRYDFSRMTDEEVVRIAQLEQREDAVDFLVNKYKNFVRAKARTYFLVGGDREDIMQEGMIGLYKATRDYKPSRLASFRAFAELCVTRQIITAIKSATRQKHQALNNYVSLSKPAYDDDNERTLLETLESSEVTDPEEMFLEEEELHNLEEVMGHVLSDLEWDVLIDYLDGVSYQEIANRTNRSVKSIDNALQRVKRKLVTYLASRSGAPAHPSTEEGR